MWTQLPGEKRIALDDENLQYTGRIDFADPQNPVFLFTASFVRFRMTGQHLRVVLTNTHHLWENRLGVVINGEQFGVLLDWDVGQGSAMFQTAVMWFYISNEALSLLENLGRCGVPIPKKLRDMLEELGKSEEEKQTEVPAGEKGTEQNG